MIKQLYTSNSGVSLKLRNALAVCLLALGYSHGSFAGSSGLVGGPDGNSFGTVYCPSGDQRIVGIKALATGNSGDRHIVGVSAICKPMNVRGGWGSGLNISTSFQQGMNSWPNTTEFSAICPDDMWVSGLRGATRKAGLRSVLSELMLQCFLSTRDGQRTGRQKTVVVLDQVSTPAGNLYCPSGEIARGFYGKSGQYLDGVGFKCVKEPGAKAPPRRRSGSPGVQFGWSNNFTASDIDKYGLAAGSADSPSQLQNTDLRDVFTGNASIRPDGMSCKGCHSNGEANATFNAGTTKAQACDQVGEFKNAGKPDNLKLLMRSWIRSRCQ